MRATHEKVEAILASLDQHGDFDEASLALEDLFDSVVAQVHQKQDAAFREVAFAIRLARQLGKVDPAIADEVYPFLRANADFARALAFLVKEDAEDLNEVYAMVDRLRRERGEHLHTYANLAAAIAVVHDKPLTRRFNENSAQAPDPVALFDYYVATEERQFFGVTSIPAELLCYVVDVTAPIEELQWAISRYAGDEVVGARFFDIAYDYDHLRTGAPKKSTLAGWGLPNILQYGGVCADQAYFAVTVGKAIGVPTAYTIGRGADVAHAWVGFLQADRRAAWWNFNAGRYETYQGLKGLVLDPQTREVVDDSAVSLLADFALSKEEDRSAAAAFTDAAIRLREYIDAGDALEAAPLEESRPARHLRKADLESQLDLLEAALTKSPGYAPAWFMVRDLAEQGELTLEHKKRWAGVLDRLCGRKYPDFSLAILKPMIGSVDDIAEQNQLWNAAFRNYQHRADLAAEVRMAQGEMWEKAGETANAGQAYMDVINRFANAGPFVVDALKKAEELLMNAGRADDVLALHDQTWRRLQRPKDMAGMFVVQSNWYRVGMMLAQKLEDRGLTQDAERIRMMIKGG